VSDGSVSSSLSVISPIGLCLCFRRRITAKTLGGRAEGLVECPSPCRLFGQSLSTVRRILSTKTKKVVDQELVQQAVLRVFVTLKPESST
jgi:hypothetical protein